MRKDTDETAETGCLLTIAELALLLRLHPQSIRKMAKDSRLPAPARLGRRCLRWRSSDILDWLSSLPTTEEVRRAI